MRTLFGLAVVIGILFAVNRPAETETPAKPSEPASPNKPFRPFRAEDYAKFVPNGITSPFDPTVSIDMNLPESLRQHNQAGRDGSGLCVFYSLLHQALWQGEEQLYGIGKQMQKELGGGWPAKVDKMLAKYAPGVQYVQHTGGDEEFLDLAFKTRRLPAITYAGKDNVHYSMVIGHMVNGAYLDDKQGAILDNNFPEEYLWMSRSQFLNRWKGLDDAGKPMFVRTLRGQVPIGGSWAIVLLNDPAPPVLK